MDWKGGPLIQDFMARPIRSRAFIPSTTSCKKKTSRHVLLDVPFCSFVLIPALLVVPYRALTKLWYIYIYRGRWFQKNGEKWTKQSKGSKGRKEREKKKSPESQPNPPFHNFNKIYRLILCVLWFSFAWFDTNTSILLFFHFCRSYFTPGGSPNFILLSCAFFK